MGSLIELTGKRFGKLVVIGRAGRDKHYNTRWLCRCDCGNETVVLGGNLTRGASMSCGCTRGGKPTHGHCGERIYTNWKQMKKRCSNPNDKYFKDYGGRGINVCKEWDDFDQFYKWAMEHGYSDELTIDRIDNDGDYCPDNCRWATQKEQARNKRNNHLLTYNGETLTMVDWAEIVGIPYNTLERRINALGWSVERALTEPVKNRSGD